MLEADEATLFAEGQALRAAGQWQEAIKTLEAASIVNPGRAETLLSIGVLRLQHNDYDAALGLIERALALRPDYAQAWDALGHVQAASGNHASALAAFTRASVAEPRHLRYRLHRAEAAVACGEAERLAEAFEVELEADPLAAGPLVGLGLIAIRRHRIEEAIDFLEAALALEDDDPEPPMLLGIAYSVALRSAPAAKMLRVALDRNPDSSTVANDLSVMLARIYCYDEALELLRANIERNGPDVLSLSNLATALAALGQMEEATERAREAMLLAPTDARAGRAFCNLLPYQEDITGSYLLAALKQVAAALGRPAALQPTVSRAPDRPLRIGLLSNLLRLHPVGWLTLAGLEALDRQEFSLHCFGRFDKNDPLARRFSRFMAGWHEIEALGDQAAATCIRDNEIDILIDLGGFGDAGRIEVCAYRPAPLQVKWVGMQYHSTGLPFMDYFISDHHETPAGYDALYAEKLLRLPDDYVCYLPPAYAPEVGVLPAAQNGYVTFGCLNNLMKMTPGTLDAWAKILNSVPGSRLLLRCTQFAAPGPRERIRKFFEGHGIAEERLTLTGGGAHRDFIGTYNRIDIALDAFPYSGGLSTCEALYMGVPVLTRAGEIFAARHSVSHLANVGLQDWIAGDSEEYVAKAIGYAGELESLARLRAGMRSRVALSPLCDAPRFGRNLGAALRGIWRDYCDLTPG